MGHKVFARKPTFKKTTRSEQKSRPLFHYTTADGLIGILQTQSLFATHADFLNDATECKAILKVLLPRLVKEIRASVPKLVERGVLNNAVLNQGDEIYRMQAEKMTEAMIRSTNKVAPYFITSFCIHETESEAYQHGLLSQWRGYARGGFAIEFDEAAIDQLNKTENECFRYQGLLTDSVEYRDHEKRIANSEFDGFGNTMLKQLFPDKAAELTDILGAKDVDEFARPFLARTPFLKDPAFSEENEYRIAALCNRPSRFEEGDNRKVKPIRFRSRQSGQLIPYIALYEELDEPLPIKSVIVGPHAQIEGQRNAVEILLEKYGLEVPIRLSGIPFRD